MKNQITTLQAIVEKIKHLLGWPKLQPYMPLQSLGKRIKQENEEGINNQKSKHQTSTYTQWFAPHLCPHIQNAMERHKSLTIVLNYLHAFNKKPREHSSPFDKLLDIFQESGSSQMDSSNQRLKSQQRRGKLLQSQNNTFQY